MKNKLIYIGIGILIILLFIFTNQNLVQIYPENNSMTTERQPIFKWIGKANKLIVDDNKEFVSPVIENVDSNPYKIKNKLNFNTYYWKLIGTKNSSVLQFTVQSLVALKLNNESDLYNVTNVGNTGIEVEIHQKKPFLKITGSIILDENETKQLKLNSSLLVAKEK